MLPKYYEGVMEYAMKSLSSANRVNYVDGGRLTQFRFADDTVLRTHR